VATVLAGRVVWRAWVYIQRPGLTVRRLASSGSIIIRYGIPSFWSIPEKVRLASDNLLVPAGNTKPVLPFSYFSAASFPLALPPVVAKGFGWPKWGMGVEGVNTKLGAWLLDKLASPSSIEDLRRQSESEKVEYSKRVIEPRIRGWSMLDYYTEPGAGDIVPLLVECNFRGRKVGEEGWF
jgi:1-phosphatidylinositol phosphodiesterase